MKYGAQKWTVIAENMPGISFIMKVAQENSADRDGTTI